MNLLGRVEKLEDVFPPPPPPTKEQRLATKMVGLFAETLRSMANAKPAVLTDEDEERILVALRDESSRSPYTQWIDALCKGYCRLPTMSPSVARVLFLALADPKLFGTYHGQMMVCNECGVLLPHDLEDNCPVCASPCRPDGFLVDRVWPWMSRQTARWLHFDRHLNAPEASTMR